MSKKWKDKYGDWVTVGDQRLSGVSIDVGLAEEIESSLSVFPSITQCREIAAELIRLADEAEKEGA